MLERERDEHLEELEWEISEEDLSRIEGLERPKQGEKEGPVNLNLSEVIELSSPHELEAEYATAAAFPEDVPFFQTTARLEEDIWLDLEKEEVCLFDRYPHRVDIAAVDTGVLILGETDRGDVLYAMRGAIVIARREQQRLQMRLYRTGILVIPGDLNQRRDLYERIGAQMGKRFLFVKKNGKLRREILADANQLTDRLRNWFEWNLKDESIQLIKEGLLLWDGSLALSSDTYDTPKKLCWQEVEKAAHLGNFILSLSKKSSQTLHDGRRLTHILDGVFEDRPCYRLVRGKELYDLGRHAAEIELDGAHATLAAVRFAPGASTFRADIVYPDRDDPGWLPCQPLNCAHTNCRFRMGYPELLYLAHAFCYFPWSSATALKAEAAGKYNLHVRQEPLTPLYPFEGRFRRW